MTLNRLNLLATIFFILLLITGIGFILVQNSKSHEKASHNDNYSRNMSKIKVDNDLKEYGIEIISASDFNFDTELTRYIGDNEYVVSLVNSAKPFSLFVKNNSSKNIAGISLRWEFKGSKKLFVEIPQSEANPGVLMGIKPIDPKIVGKTSLISKKDVRFFTYFKDVVGSKVSSANMRHKNLFLNSSKIPDSNPLYISRLDSLKKNLLSQYSDFSVYIDGVFFEDGTFVGKDRNFFFDTLRGTVEARKDILTDINSAKVSGKNNSDILDEILDKTSNIFIYPLQSNKRDVTSEQVFDTSYNSYLKSLREEILMKRSKLSDDSIVDQFQSVKISDFATLRKVETDNQQ